MLELKTKIAKELIKNHEGFSQFPYKCTSGKLTIGYGLNLEDKGITEEQASVLLEDEIRDYPQKLRELIYSFYGISFNRQAVLIDMAYNLGFSGLAKFKKMIAAIKEKDFKKAAEEMLDSDWARQVGSRAIDLSDIMRTNVIT